ncbi:hypothetical protein ACLOJK_002547 [Asimina triloba]
MGGFFLGAALVANTELDRQSHPIDADASQFHGSIRQGKDETDANCWTVPNGQGFMIRGKTYLKDLSKHSQQQQLLETTKVDVQQGYEEANCIRKTSL